ncbi:MAG: aminoacyl-tRNA deacylase [Synergistaceae bacterium]|jgi:Cys-tRNA(Pro)/Cys-tRNA(Cys) deacylase|nr:aminoacyl-tRNA deacylase [Synergistaceae bacterium]
MADNRKQDKRTAPGSAANVRKTNAARRLDELGVAYELLSFEADEDDLSAERAAISAGMAPEVVYKTLVVRGDRTGVMEACIPAGTELDLKALSSLSGNRSASLVPLRSLTPLTGYVRGGCSPIGGRKAYPVFISDEAFGHEKIAINAGSRGLLFLMSPHDLVRVTGASHGKIARHA